MSKWNNEKVNRELSKISNFMYSQQTSDVSIHGNIHSGIQQMSPEFLLHLTSMNHMEIALNC